MSNTLVKVEFTQLPEHTSRARELEWTMNWWKKEHAESGLMKASAWKIYNEAIDEGEPKDILDELYTLAEMFDAICDDTWQEWNKAQADYLQLFN